jgi:hypothetical protein
MKSNRLLSMLFSVGLGVVSMIHPLNVRDAHAAKPKSAATAPVEPPMTKKPIALPLPGIVWGQSPKQVADALDKLVDADYQQQYKEVSPGVRMKALDAQVAEEKSQFRRSRVDFGKLPTGVDSTPLRGEYTYQNKESMMTLTRKGANTHFFFIGDRLWKLIVEYKLTEGAALGKTYLEGVVKLSTIYGIPGRVSPPNDTRFVTEVDWKDGTTHVRAIERGENALGLAYEDSATVASLPSLRTNKPVDENGIDPAVAAAVRGQSQDPGPPPPKDDKSGKPKR